MLRRHHRAHVRRVEPHLVAEPAADVGRHDADPVLRDARHPREQHPVRVRGLRGRPDGELVGDRVVVGHDAAGLQRRRVHPRVDQVAGAHVLGGRERGVGGRGVARLPVEDVVVGLVAHRAARRRPARGGRRPRRAAARTRRRSARARRGRRSGSRRRRTPPPAPGSAPRRWRARPARRAESVGIQARPRSASCSPVMTARTSGCDSAAACRRRRSRRGRAGCAARRRAACRAARCRRRTARGRARTGRLPCGAPDRSSSRSAGERVGGCSPTPPA